MPRIAKHWFRFYSEALDSLKVEQLKPPLFKTWVKLLCLANVSHPRGTLPSNREIAFALRAPENVIDRAISDLIIAGLIDRVGDECVMHDWDEWQADRDVPPSQRGGDVTRRLEINHANVTGSARLRHANGTATSQVDHARVDQSGGEGKSGVEKSGLEQIITPLTPLAGGDRVGSRRKRDELKDDTSIRSRVKALNGRT